jgi:LysR family glycine cleavage system transcriptional activator
MRKKLPSLTALRSFEAAARHGSFKAAADELCVSHSAISHQVKLLEGQLGVDLFVRKARAVELTRAGQAYFPVLRGAFDAIGEATEHLLAPQGAGVLTLQVYSTFAIRWLIPRLSEFQARHPEVQVRLHTAQTDVDFAHDDVDACVRIGQPQQPDLHIDYLFSSQLFPVCSPALLDAGGLCSAADLAHHTLLQVAPSPRDWDTWLHAHGLDSLDPNAGLVLDSYDIALATAAQGLGVALGRQPYMAREFAAGTLVEVFPGARIPHEDDWYFVCRRGREFTSKVALFRDWLLAQIGEDPENFPPSRVRPGN